VKVTPEGVEAFWRNERGSLSSFEKLTALEVEQAVTRMKSVNPDLAGIPGDYRPRRSLGLFVFRGKASFRRIVIKPLTHSDG
jgi:hypothetical protein